MGVRLSKQPVRLLQLGVVFASLVARCPTGGCDVNVREDYKNGRGPKSGMYGIYGNLWYGIVDGALIWHQFKLRVLPHKSHELW